MTDPGLLARTLFQKNWPKFGSILVDCIYTSVVKPEYDTDAGEDIPNTDPVDPTENLTIIFDEFNVSNSYSTLAQTNQIEIQSLDKVALFPTLDLSFKPKINDTILDDDSVNWRVIGVGSDAAKVHYNLHVRPLK